MSWVIVWNLFCQPVVVATWLECCGELLQGCSGRRSSFLLRLCMRCTRRPTVVPMQSTSASWRTVSANRHRCRHVIAWRRRKCLPECQALRQLLSRDGGHAGGGRVSARSVPEGRRTSQVDTFWRTGRRRCVRTRKKLFAFFGRPIQCAEREVHILCAGSARFQGVILEASQNVCETDSFRI